MPNEHTPPEQHEQLEQTRPVFDFEQMEPYQVAGLVTALGMAYRAKEFDRDPRDDVPEDYTYSGLLELAAQELKNMARTSDKALGIYGALTGDPSSPYAQQLATDMAPELLRRHVDDPVIRQQIINPWVSMLQHEDSGVRETAEYSIAVNCGADWLDEATRQYLESQLPDEE